MHTIDILVKNGHIIDPAAGIDAVGCIGIDGGKSVGMVSADCSAQIEIDATGYYIFPGLVDFHTHIFYGGSSLCVDPNCLIPMGVTTAADAGSVGCSNFRVFNKYIVPNSAVSIRTYLSMCSYGQPGNNFDEDFNPDMFQVEKIKRLLEEFPEQIKGLKIRMGAEILQGRGLEPLRRAKEIATQLGCPIVVHASNPPTPEAELLEILGKGDVMCHCFHGKGENKIIDEDGRVLDEVLSARERGVIFDCANGITNYNHDVAQKALADGFLPDIISSDMCTPTFNLNGYAKSLPYVMSKYLGLGMKLTDVVRAVTETPAKQLGLSGKAGTLAEGAFGDLVVCKCVEAAPVFLDNFQKTMTGDQMLVPLMTIKGGEILYCQTNF